MKGPDVVALQEIEDDSGCDDDGQVSAKDTLRALVDAIEAIDASLQYEFIDNTFIGDRTNGGSTEEANIRVAYLYNPARVSVVMSSLNTIVDPIDQRSDSGNPFFDSRLPLAATFTFLPTGYVFEMVNNHWSSKINGAPTMGTEQPFEDLQEDSTVNGALDRRQEQSAAIKAYVTGKDNVIVLGTLNDYEFVSPVADLGDVMTILTNAIAPNERYSYINQGNSEALDHILVSKGMTATSEYVHVNTELEGRSSTTSDHDPMVALVAAPEPPSAMPSRSPSKRPTRDDPVSRPVDHEDHDDDNDGCTNNITIKNFFWKWIVCLLKWLFGKKWK
jgi:uncharacterized protein